MRTTLAAVALTLVASSASDQESGVDPDLMRLHFIDVGQGDATLIEFPCGAALIDVGGENTAPNNGGFRSLRPLLDYLDAFFLRRRDLDRTIDVMFLTHPHSDHVGNSTEVMGRYTVRNLVDNGQKRGEQEEAQGLAADDPQIGYQAASFQRASDVSPQRGSTIDPFPNCEGTDPQIQVLWGEVRTDPGYGTCYQGRPCHEGPNFHSLVVRVDFGRASVLFTGDLETEAINTLVEHTDPDLLDVDVYHRSVTTDRATARRGDSLTA